MGGERRARGFHFGDFGHRKWRSTTAAVAAIAAAPRARRGELTGSREGAGRGLGLVGRAMRCSPQEELNRDGPGEEIDGEVCSRGKKQRRRN